MVPKLIIMRCSFQSEFQAPLTWSGTHSKKGSRFDFKELARVLLRLVSLLKNGRTNPRFSLGWLIFILELERNSLEKLRQQTKQSRVGKRKLTHPYGRELTPLVVEDEERDNTTS